MSPNSNICIADNSVESTSSGSSPLVAAETAVAMEPTTRRVRSKLAAIPTAPQPKRVYTCTSCAKPFYTPQALGGHQNAHRRELNEMDMRLEYIQRRREAARSIAAALDGKIEQPPERNRAKENGGSGGGRGNGRGSGRGRGRGHGGAIRKIDEPAALSLELSLGIGGRPKRKMYMEYSFTEVLWPACEVPKGMDLTLKL